MIIITIQAYNKEKTILKIKKFQIGVTLKILLLITRLQFIFFDL